MKRKKNLLVTTDMLREDGLVSKPYTMISEFIDNSISSWIGLNGHNKLNELAIEITFDYHLEDNFQISIIDNAYGMNVENLENSLEFANTDKKFKKSNLNRYGVGMKVATFWSGNKLEIWTKTENKEENFVYIDLEELDQYNNKIVEYEVEKKPAEIRFNYELNDKFYRNRGTKIKISRGNFSRYDLLKKSNFIHFCNVISFKFNKFIEMGVNISIGIINEKGKDEYLTLESFTPKSENISTWINDVVKNSNKIKTENKNEIIEKFKIDFLKALENYNLNEEIIFDIKEKIKFEKKLKWECNIYLGKDENEDYFLPIKIGILRNAKEIKSEFKFNYVSYTGFTVYESKRAIMCGPNDFDDSQGSKNYIAGLRTNYGGKGIEYRIFGEFEIDDLILRNYVSISDQKFGFEWKNKKFEEKFLNFINEWKEKYAPILNTLTSMQSNYSEPEKWTLSKQAQATLKNTYNNSLNFYNDESMEETVVRSGGTEFFYIYRNPKTGISGKIKIIHIESNYVSENFYTLSKKESNNYEIILNILHPIWKPLVSGPKITKTSFISSLHRLSFILACLNDISNGSANIINEIANSSFIQQNV
ncbi:ATP-binding protein [Spiroplasma cantharicola]|uniref:Histidine kinase/HSP90-like ATPase domain-containing protein n=1 Tax=Spiroplasma cantharicola TaxID=362837 RepID=A0A0M5KLN8_9MOLU|nr:ATP-binding protein [Spiroplasma cantharicola]ALD66576.1 hypothetical protein SCANT_v1c06700 [Spiroplasma cantharicola]